MRRKFMELEAWKQAHVLVLEVYKYAKKLPRKEQDGLALEVRNSAIAIGAKIASGSVLDDAGFRDALETAVMSARMVEMQLYVIRDLGYLSSPEVDRLHKLTAEVRSLLIEEISRLPVESS